MYSPILAPAMIAGPDIPRLVPAVVVETIKSQAEMRDSQDERGTNEEKERLEEEKMEME